MKKPIIIYHCENCKKSTFFGIEDESEDYLIYKCRGCGKIEAFSKYEMGVN